MSRFLSRDLNAVKKKSGEIWEYLTRERRRIVTEKEKREINYTKDA